MKEFSKVKLIIKKWYKIHKILEKFDKSHSKQDNSHKSLPWTNPKN